MALTDVKVKELELKANDIRQSIIEMLLAAGSGHTAGPLDMADIFTYLYFHALKHDPKKPSWSERDRVVLSKVIFAQCCMRRWGMLGISR